MRHLLHVEKGGPRSHKVGDRVRISKVKGVFAKGYEANWTEQIYVIASVNNTMPASYALKDLQGEPIVGRFYEEELQKTNQSTYRIEKIIDKKVSKDGVELIRVKWRGYPNKFNQWINKSEVDVNTAPTLKMKDTNADEKIDRYFIY